MSHFGRPYTNAQRENVVKLGDFELAAAHACEYNYNNMAMSYHMKRICDERERVCSQA